jgi:uncharacterized membrane protein
VWGGLFLLSEMIYVDDIYGGQFNRFNTALKWWGWIYAGSLITLGAVNMGGDSRVARYGTVLVMLLVGTYSYELANSWLFSPKTDAGRFSGHNWFTYDPTNKAMLNYLSSAGPGIVLDRNEKGSYTRSSTFALFSGKPALLGWADHEWMWRGSPNHVRMMGEQINAFYLGNKSDSLDWLLQNNVRYIIWGAEENGRSPSAFANIQQMISRYYYWKEFYNAGDYRVGIWVNKPPT